MPELPEVEIVARLLSRELQGVRVEKIHVQGVSTLKSFDPPISEVEGAEIKGLRRIGKHLLVDFSNELTLLIHLMSSGRLQIFETRGSPRDRSIRLIIRMPGRELRLREFGTKQSSWAKLLPASEVQAEEALSTLGPEAWPDPPPFKQLLSSPRPLNALLRDQRVIAGIGRSWADEILHRAQLSPFKRGDTLTEDEAERLRTATLDILGGAIEHYEKTLSLPIPDKLPMPLEVHRRETQPCARCGGELQAVYFESHTIAYCPLCQTGGKVLKDRRLSRLLK